MTFATPSTETADDTITGDWDAAYRKMYAHASKLELLLNATREELAECEAECARLRILAQYQIT